MPTINQAIASGSHDMWTSLGGNYSVGDTALRWGYQSGNEFESLLHFPDTGIPQGATITAATLSLYNASNGGQPIGGIIDCEDSDNASCPTASNTAASIPRTTAKTSWSCTTAFGAHTTADFSASVQEVVDRPGFGGNLNVCLNHSGSGTLRANPAAYESGANYAVLNVTYTDPAPTGGGNRLILLMQ